LIDIGRRVGENAREAGQEARREILGVEPEGTVPAERTADAAPETPRPVVPAGPAHVPI
jgi:hypothetical protein